MGQNWHPYVKTNVRNLNFTRICLASLYFLLSRCVVRKLFPHFLFYTAKVYSKHFIFIFIFIPWSLLQTKVKHVRSEFRTANPSLTDVTLFPKTKRLNCYPGQKIAKLVPESGRRRLCAVQSPLWQRSMKVRLMTTQRSL